MATTTDRTAAPQVVQAGDLPRLEVTTEGIPAQEHLEPPERTVPADLPAASVETAEHRFPWVVLGLAVLIVVLGALGGQRGTVIAPSGFDLSPATPFQTLSAAVR